MKTKIITAVILLLNIFSNFSSAQMLQPALDWSKKFDGPLNGNGIDIAKCVVTDNKGNVYVSGESQIAGTGKDIVLVKYDPLGNPIDTARFRHTGDDILIVMKIDPSYKFIYIGGMIDSVGNGKDFIVLKYDAATLKLQSSGANRFPIYFDAGGHQDDYLTDMVVNANYVYICGYGFHKISDWLESSIVIKYDLNGNLSPTWTNDPGGNFQFEGINPKYFDWYSCNPSGCQYGIDHGFSDKAYSIDVDNLDNVFVANESVHTGNDYSATVIYGYNSVGAVYYNYCHSSGCQYGSYHWLLFTVYTSPLVSQSFGTAGDYSSPTKIKTDGSGNVFVCGQIDTIQGIGGTSFHQYVFKNIGSGYNLNHAVLNHPSTDGIANDGATSMQLYPKSSGGNIYVTGYYNRKGKRNLSVFKIDNSLSGTNSWVYKTNSANLSYGTSIDVCSSNFYSVRVTGYDSTSNRMLVYGFKNDGTQTWKDSVTASKGRAIISDGFNNIIVVGDSIRSNGIADFITRKYCEYSPSASAKTDTVICSGKSVRLTATGGIYSYSWSPSIGLNVATISNPTASPTTTTTYMVTAANSPGCQAIATVVVTVNPLPAVTATSTPSAVCSNSKSVLSANCSSNCNDITYTWSPAIGLSNTTGLSVDAAVSTTVTTTYTYTVTGMVSTGCTSTATTTVKVDPNLLPSVIISTAKSSICAGDIATFTAAPINGGSSPTYQWQINGTDTLGETNRIFSSNTLNNNDSIICTMTSNYQCINGSATVGSDIIVMQVKQYDTARISISISPSDTICKGTNAIFSATATNGGTTPAYQWEVNGGTVGTNSLTYSSSTLNKTDVISCMLTSNLNCVTGSPVMSNIITVTIDTLPKVSFTGLKDTLCLNGSDVTLIGNPMGGTFNGPGVTGNIFNSVGAGTGSHIITYSFKDGHNCENSFNKIVFVDVCTGVIALGGISSFTISPNPCTTCEIIGAPNIKDLIITDIVGRNCLVSFTKSSKGYLISLPETSNGFFLIRNMKTGEVKKFVKEKD